MAITFPPIVFLLHNFYANSFSNSFAQSSAWFTNLSCIAGYSPKPVSYTHLSVSITNGKFWFDAIFEKEEIPGIVSTSISPNNLSIT